MIPFSFQYRLRAEGDDGGDEGLRPKPVVDF
jgi:hypothetical protein